MPSMIGPCIAYRPDGRVCRAPAMVLDRRRGGLVCVACHWRQALDDQVAVTRAAAPAVTPPTPCATRRDTIGSEPLYALGGRDRVYVTKLVCTSGAHKVSPAGYRDWARRFGHFRDCRRCSRRRYYGTGRPRPYCTEACEAAARCERREQGRPVRRVLQLACRSCGEPLPTTMRADARYCSSRCRERACRDRRSSPRGGVRLPTPEVCPKLAAETLRLAWRLRRQSGERGRVHGGPIGQTRRITLVPPPPAPRPSDRGADRPPHEIAWHRGAQTPRGRSVADGAYSGRSSPSWSSPGPRRRRRSGYSGQRGVRSR
jgi:hypothetical protein